MPWFQYQHIARTVFQDFFGSVADYGTFHHTARQRANYQQVGIGRKQAIDQCWRQFAATEFNVFVGNPVVRQ